MPEALNSDYYPDGTSIPDFNPPKREPGATPKVSILLITYNHGKYIGAAIESILMQKTVHPYTIHVIEDCSTDNTQEVVMRYAAKYPDIVIPFFNKVNIGRKVTQKNFYRGFCTMNGEYLAILEGDDYWSSPDKLQRQVDFLEANPEYVGCGHNTIKIYEDGSQEPHRFLYYENAPEEHTIEDMIYIRTFFHASSMMFRNVYGANPPKYFSNPWSCDLFINIAFTQFGKVKFWDEDMSVYRGHAGGQFSTMKILDGWFFNVGGLRRWNAWLGYKYLKTFAKSLARYCRVVMYEGRSYDQRKLTWYEWTKYFCLYVMYQFTYYALAIPQDAWNYSQKFLPASMRRFKPLALGIFILLFIPIGFVITLIVIAKLLLTHSISLFVSKKRKARILEWEKTHPNVRNLRMVAMYGNLFSRDGVVVVRNLLFSIAGNSRWILYRYGIRIRNSAYIAVVFCSGAAYRLLSRITPGFISRRLRALAERYETLGHYHGLLWQGRLLTRDGLRSTGQLVRIGMGRLFRQLRKSA